MLLSNRLADVHDHTLESHEAVLQQETLPMCTWPTWLRPV